MKITVETHIGAPLAAVWHAFNDPDHIMQWDSSDDWQTTWASNDLRVGGLLQLCIEAKDGSTGFDFSATYTRINPKNLIEWRMDDNRHVQVKFLTTGSGVSVRQTFDAELAPSPEDQRIDWQGILDSFSRHVVAINMLDQSG